VRTKHIFASGNTAGMLVLVAMIAAVFTLIFGIAALPRWQAVLALIVFNDVILRVAIEHRLRAIDLRLICTQAADYANPIEPSRSGGRKIAQAILRAVGAAKGHIQFASVYAG
jgi:hypothetical protein